MDIEAVRGGPMPSPPAFSVLGIEPALGHAFSAEEETAPDAKVAMISYAMWQRRHGARSDVLGKTITINGRPFEIVGVGPQRFMGTEPLSTDVWVPLGAQPILLGRITCRIDRTPGCSSAWAVPARGSTSTVERISP